MKLKQVMHFAALTAALAFGAATASAVVSNPYPFVPLSISGTVFYATNNDTLKMGAPLVELSFSVQSLINLLNASATATNTIQIVTGKKQIPAGSYFLWNPDEQNLIITNANHFSFPLEGSYTMSGSTNTVNYDYGYLDIDDDDLIGTYSLNAKTLSGSETDRTGIYFVFNDGSDNEIEIYGSGILSWTYGAAKHGSQTATLTVTINGGNNGQCEVDGYDAIGASISGTGTVSASEPTNSVPFFWNW